MKLADVKDVAIIGGLAVAAFYVWKGLQQVPKAYNAAVDATTDALWAVFGPSDQQAIGDTLFYVVHFSNGNHAIPASTVDSQGRFTYRGANFIMRDKVLADGKREHWAFAG